MSYLSRAISLLQHGGYTCILCDRDRTMTDKKTGIAPLLERISEREPLQGMCVADRIIGKAAALLLLHAGVSAVYGEVMSEQAFRLLTQAGLTVRYGTLVPFIQNRAGTDRCPMERAVEAVDDPAQAPAALRAALAALKAQANS